MLKRGFDIIFSFLGIVILLPFILVFFFLVIIESRGGFLFVQKRVGENNIDFSLFKIRTMYKDADKKGLITVGAKNERITKIGYFLRKFKLDEFPQLFNILLGDMSFVGPRPEVRKYVEMYNPEQLKVLTVRPGLTDIASLKYYNESELLSKYPDPEKAYIETIMPHKLELNLEYIERRNFLFDLKIIFRTLFKWVK
jgi:lipopolysaccharide/colanic/teichoic acid biosynthesis glycosyltransferase